MIKKTGKKILVRLLGWQVRRLANKNHTLKIIAVSGSVGKTSTKLAIAHVLSDKVKVQYQKGNYNDALSVPLVFFGHKMPRIWNIPVWLKIIIKNEWLIHDGYPYDVAVVELGTDKPGDLSDFGRYLNPDITVVTSITEEHMEFFDNLEAVAKEELVPIGYSKKIFINISEIDAEFVPKAKNIFTYGTTKKAQNTAAAGRLDNALNRIVSVALKDKNSFTFKLPSPSKNQAMSALAAATVANELGFSVQSIKESLESLQMVPGRTQLLRGIHSSWLLDDTYNATLASMLSALELLYEIDAYERIAILGSMNELGSFSQEAHKEVGSFCNPKKLSLVITIGHDAYHYLAPAAESAGCRVERFLDPVAAGQCAAENIKKNTVVLAKGSQNGIFAEEALKLLLAKEKDKTMLVRQSRAWIRIKRRQFPTVKN